MSLYKDASLVMLPSAYKDGKLYSIRPTDGDGDFTFSRGSNLAATRVDVNGLIEKGRENLLLQSNQFDTTWTTSAASVTSGQSGYDGSNDAWLLTATNTFNRVQQSIGISGVKRFSVYAKANTNDYLLLGSFEGAHFYATFNLATGAVDSNNINAISASIEDVGNGWYRCSATWVNTTTQVRIGTQDASGQGAWASTTSGNIYIQDAQLEQGLVATDYIETGTSAAQSGILEDMPRLDYSGSCPSLLLEPQRTNVVPNSEYFNSSSGWTLYDADVIQNAISSPDGLTNASKVLRDSTSYGSLFVYNATGYSVTNGTTYMMSAFVKEGSGVNNFDFNFDHSGSGGYPIGTGGSSRWSFNNGLTKEAGGDYAGYEDYGNGWYRIWVKGVASADGVCQYGFKGAAGTPLNSYFHIYGVQFEQGSYPTSYIPTYGTSQTRSLDVPSLASLQSNDIFGSTQGTALVEFSPLQDGYMFDYHINSVKYIRLYYNASSEELRVRDTIASQWYNTYLSLPEEQNSKVLLRWDNTTLTAFVNGSKAATDYTLTETIAIDYLEDLKTNKVKQISFFPTALTDSECIALTTL